MKRLTFFIIGAIVMAILTITDLYIASIRMIEQDQLSFFFSLTAAFVCGLATMIWLIRIKEEK